MADNSILVKLNELKMGVSRYINKPIFLAYDFIFSSNQPIPNKTNTLHIYNLKKSIEHKPHRISANVCLSLVRWN